MSMPASRQTTSSRRRFSWPPRSPSSAPCCPALERLHRALAAKAIEFDSIVKTGRTHLQDATPIRLGQEFVGYAGQVEASIRRAQTASGRAPQRAPRRARPSGTGINAPAGATAAHVRPAGRPDRPGGPRDRQPFPRAGHARHGHRRPRRDPGHRPEPVEDRLGHPADGHGSASRPGRAVRCPRRSRARASCPAR